jgi:hypothetical protein
MDMNKHRALFPILMIALVALGLGVAGRAEDDDGEGRGRKVQTLEFDAIQLFFELNDTDGDLGLQLNLGAEPWKELTIFDPRGKKILDLEAKGSLREFGLSDLFFESNEPSFDEVSMEEILATFPEGKYEFVGRTIEGDRLLGWASLTHDIPDAPVICSPGDGDTVDPGDVVVSWKEVDAPAGSEIVAYQVIVTNDEDSRFRYDVRVPAGVTSLAVPEEFFEEDTEYELEVLAVEESGNQTISIVFFTTE